jgi:hypothetical protein
MSDADNVLGLWKVFMHVSHSKLRRLQQYRTLDASKFVFAEIHITVLYEFGLLIVGQLAAFVWKDGQLRMLAEVMHHGTGSTFWKGDNGKVNQPTGVTGNVPSALNNRVERWSMLLLLLLWHPPSRRR